MKSWIIAARSNNYNAGITVKLLFTLHTNILRESLQHCSVTAFALRGSWKIAKFRLSAERKLDRHFAFISKLRSSSIRTKHVPFFLSFRLWNYNPAMIRRKNSGHIHGQNRTNREGGGGIATKIESSRAAHHLRTFAALEKAYSIWHSARSVDRAHGPDA